MRQVLAALLVLGAVIGLAKPASAESWHRAETRSFVIYSDGSASNLEDFAIKIEMFDALFMEYFGLDAPPPPNPLTIYLVKDQEDVARYHGSSSVAGFYIASSEGSFAVSNRERGLRRGSLSGETVLFHEYVHHAMARYFTFGYPPWYREGFAEFFATADIEKDGDWELGIPANHRVAGLRRRVLPLEAVLFGDLSSMNRDAANSYYGRSWALVHMTVFNPQRRAHLTDYLSRLGSGEEPREAFAASFGDLDTLEDEVDQHIRGAISSLKSQSPIAMKGDVTVTSLDRVASQLVPLTIKRRVGRGRELVAEELRAFAAEHPDRPDVLAEWALAEFAVAERADEPDYTAALAATDAALALHHNHARMLLLKAQISIENLANADEVTDEQWTQIGSLISRSYTADPTIPLTHVVNYHSFLEQSSRPPVEVINALGEALMLAPEARDIRLQYAWALANENAFDDAIHLVKFLASDPHQGGMGRNVLRQLEEYRDRRMGQ